MRTCHKPMPRGDLHESCLKCLGETHQADSCKICRGFQPQIKEDWSVRPKHLLMEGPLHPKPSSDSARSTSVQSMPAYIRDFGTKEGLGTKRAQELAHSGTEDPAPLTFPGAAEEAEDGQGVLSNGEVHWERED